MSRNKPHPRSVEGERTKKEILRVGLELLAENGYAKTTISQIADRAHTYRSSVDWHFGGKEGLLLAVMDHYLDEELLVMFQRELKKFLEENPNATHHQIVTDFCFKFLHDTIVNHYVELMVLFRITFEEMPDNPKLAEKIRGFWSRFTDMMVEAIRKGQKAGTLDPDLQPDWTARAILALVQGLFMQWYLDRERHEIETTISSLVTGISKLLKLDMKPDEAEAKVESLSEQ